MLPVADITRPIEWAITAARMVAVWIAFKALALVVVGTLVPIAIYTGWKMIREKIYSAVQYSMPDTWSGAMIQLTGMGAYIADNIYLPQAVAIVLSAMSVAWTLSFIRGR